MKLVTFEISTAVGPMQRIGAIHQDKIIDLNMGYTRYLAEKRNNGRPYELAMAVLPPDMIAFFRSGQEGKKAAETTIDYITEKGSKTPVMGPRGEKIVYDMAEVTGIRARTCNAHVQNLKRAGLIRSDRTSPREITVVRNIHLYEVAK